MCFAWADWVGYIFQPFPHDLDFIGFIYRSRLQVRHPLNIKAGGVNFKGEIVHEKRTGVVNPRTTRCAEKSSVTTTMLETISGQLAQV
jgi:hypothetical protein